MNPNHMLVTVLLNNARSWNEIGDEGKWQQHLNTLLEQLGWGRWHIDERYPTLIIICTKRPLDTRWVFDIFQNARNFGGELLKEYTKINISPAVHVLYTKDELFEEITEHLSIPAVAMN